MPIYQDPDQRCGQVFQADSPPNRPTMHRQLSEESIRTEFCDGPLLEGQEFVSEMDITDHKVESEQEPLTIETNDRQELIHRLKREQSPTLGPYLQLSNPSHEPRDKSIAETLPASGPRRPNAPLLLPAIELKNIAASGRNGSHGSSASHLGHGYGIARPRSALHAGNFTTEGDSRETTGEKPTETHHDKIEVPQRTTPPPSTPWPKSGHGRRASLQSYLPAPTQAVPIDVTQRPSRSRAPSLHSFSSSFVFKAPTSPLVQQANNEDLDLSPEHTSNPRGKENRRYTLPPNSLQNWRSLNGGLAQAARQPLSLQREESYPFTKAQNRRSLGSAFPPFSSSPYSSPPSGFLRSRRPSFSGDASPLQHTSMVGSYEESILRGRMSGTPSKPVNFTATIGALGKGDCKPKYPAHVSLEFPAVFYSWSSSNSARSAIDDEPSPYSGQIDLEHNLSPPKKKEKRSNRRQALQLDEQDELSESPSRRASSKNREKRRQRTLSPNKLPLGGSYRIPQEGHLQILIKNPNKSAVKLFLVPYDLHGMEAGTKTFIRQKCYSAGPVIENPITSKCQSESAIDSKTMLNDPKNKPTLRYLIHLQICCPSKGKFYLYKNINVVFANRVPDNKEKLQNEIRLPEPRYSPYKPNTDPTASSLGSDHRRLLDKNQRRRSHGFDGNANSYDSPQGIDFSRGLAFADNIGNSPRPPVPTLPRSYTTPEKLAHPLPVRNSSLAQQISPGSNVPEDDEMALDTSSRLTSPPAFPPLSRQQRTLSPILSGSVRSSSSNNSNDSYNKLSRGDAGYGGMFGRPGTPEPGEGLLARKLRSLNGLGNEFRTALGEEAGGSSRSRSGSGEERVDGDHET